MPREADPVGVAVLLVLVGGILVGVLLSWSTLLARALARRPILPTRAAPVVPWNGLAVMGTIGLWLVLNLVVGLGMRAMRKPGSDITPLELMGGVSLLNLILLAIVPPFLRLWGSVRSGLGIRGRTMAGDLTLGVAAALVLAPPVYLVQALVLRVWKPTPHPLMKMVLEERNPWVLGLAFVSAVVLAPMAEELFFRGILQGWLERRARGGREEVETAFAGGDQAGAAAEVPTAAAEGGPSAPVDLPDGAGSGPWSPPGPTAVPGPTRRPGWFALLFPATAFAGVHYGQWPAPIPLLLLAVGLGVLYRRTGGIVAPMAMHATFNGLSTSVLIVGVGFDLLPPDLLKSIDPEPAARVSVTRAPESSLDRVGFRLPAAGDGFKLLGESTDGSWLSPPISPPKPEGGMIEAGAR